MKHISVLALFLISVLTLNAQKVFQSGNYTTLNDQSFSGLIKVLSEKEIEFKPSKEATSVILNANKIRGFEITTPFKKYESFKDESGITEFYAYVVESAISLLVKDQVYFLRNDENGMQKLEVKKVEKSTDKGLFESTINSYIGVLSYFAKDCQELQSEAEKVAYKRKSLSKYVIELNDCLGNSINDFSIDESVVNLFEVGITAGGNFASFETIRSNDSYKTSDPSFGLSIGGFVSFSPDIKKYNLSFIVGVEYNQKIVEDYTFRRVIARVPRTVNHNASVLEPYLVGIYQPFYNKNWFISPYLGIGTSYGFTLSHDIEESDQFTDLEYENDTDQTFSFLYKIGMFINVKGHKFMLEGAFSDYSYQTPGSEKQDFGNNFQLKLGYVIDLTKK